MKPSDLKQFVILSYLTDAMLEKLVPITDVLSFDINEYVFKQGDDADRFYMVSRGKVLLEQRITETLTVSLSAIKPGFSFGWSAMLDHESYSTDAICAEPTRIYSFKSKHIKALMQEDHRLGFILSQRLLVLIKKRFDARTEQFVKTIKLHPEINALL